MWGFVCDTERNAAVEIKDIYMAEKSKNKTKKYIKIKGSGGQKKRCRNLAAEKCLQSFNRGEKKRG